MVAPLPMHSSSGCACTKRAAGRRPGSVVMNCTLSRRPAAGRIGAVTDLETTDSEGVSFPRLMARTMRFTLGIPRALRVSPNGERVAFVRAVSGTRRTGQLWVLDVGAGEERLVADPLPLLSAGGEELTAEERARRERLREGGAGITSYSADRRLTRAVFALSSRLFVADLAGDARVFEIPTEGGVVDPHVSPDGQWVSYAADGAVHVVSIDGDESRPLVKPDGEHVSWGLAEFVAAEELGRYRGMWWSPDSQALLVARVDESPVNVFYVGNAEQPETEPYAHRYPAAGTPNAEVSLWHIDLDGTRVPVRWDPQAWPYLVDVSWTPDRAALLLLMDRRQQRQLLVSVADPAAPVEEREISRREWVDVVPGTPAWWGERLLTVEIHADTYRLFADGNALTPEGLQVRAVVDVDEDAVLVLGGVDPAEQRPYLVAADGGITALGPDEGVSAARRAGGTTVLRTETLSTPAPEFHVVRQDGSVQPGPRVLALDPGLRPQPSFTGAGSRTVVLLPQGWTPGDGPLPVLMEPYGGPHHAEVGYAARTY